MKSFDNHLAPRRERLDGSVNVIELPLDTGFGLAADVLLHNVPTRPLRRITNLRALSED